MAGGCKIADVRVVNRALCCDVGVQPYIVIFARSRNLVVVAPLKSAASKGRGDTKKFSIHHLHLLPTMFYHTLTTLLSLASIVSAASETPTLYLVGDGTMANLGDNLNPILGYVAPIRPCVNQ